MKRVVGGDRPILGSMFRFARMTTMSALAERTIPTLKTSGETYTGEHRN
jgi:hypothetical protein